MYGLITVIRLTTNRTLGFHSKNLDPRHNYYTSEFIFFRQFMIRGVAIAYNAIAGLSFYSY